MQARLSLAHVWRQAVVETSNVAGVFRDKHWPTHHFTTGADSAISLPPAVEGHIAPNLHCPSGGPFYTPKALALLTNSAPPACSFWASSTLEFLLSLSLPIPAGANSHSGLSVFPTCPFVFLRHHCLDSCHNPSPHRPSSRSSSSPLLELILKSKSDYITPWFKDDIIKSSLRPKRSSLNCIGPGFISTRLRPHMPQPHQTRPSFISPSLCTEASLGRNALFSPPLARPTLSPSLRHPLLDFHSIYIYISITAHIILY